MTNVFMGKVFLLVTGASRGIGKQIAENFGSLLQNESHVLLLARNIDNLIKTADKLPKHLAVTCKSVDFSKTNSNELREIILESLKHEKANNFNQAIIVHNAALASFSQLTTEMTDFDEWQKCFNLNTFSPAVLNSIFMNIFDCQNVKKYIINISSYWSSKPEAYVGSYCSAKAAKDMFFKVFALENPDVNVLHYLPGIVKTDMYFETMKNFKERKYGLDFDETKVVTTAETVEYLVDVLRKQKYKSGDYVDYNKKMSYCI